MEERNVERMEAALELLRHMMKEELSAKSSYIALDELNYVLVVAGQVPVLKEVERDVQVIDTI